MVEVSQNNAAGPPYSVNQVITNWPTPSTRQQKYVGEDKHVSWQGTMTSLEFSAKDSQ